MECDEMETPQRCALYRMWKRTKPSDMGMRKEYTTRGIYIDGVFYRNRVEASKAFKVDYTTVSNWMKRGFAIIGGVRVDVRSETEEELQDRRAAYGGGKDA